MIKPVYYIHRTINQSNEEIEKKIKLLMDAGFKVVIISDGEEKDLTSCLRKIICINIHQ